MKQHHVFSFLQRMGKSFMLPIAVLPVAGLSYYRTRSYSSNNSSFLFYLEVISYHWREVNHYNLRHP